MYVCMGVYIDTDGGHGLLGRWKRCLRPKAAILRVKRASNRILGNSADAVDRSQPRPDGRQRAGAMRQNGAYGARNAVVGRATRGARVRYAADGRAAPAPPMARYAALSRNGALRQRTYLRHGASFDASRHGAKRKRRLCAQCAGCCALRSALRSAFDCAGRTADARAARTESACATRNAPRNSTACARRTAFAAAARTAFATAQNCAW